MMVKLRCVVLGLFLFLSDHTNASLDSLCTDNKRLVCMYLSANDLCRLAQVNLQWNYISSSDYVWSVLAQLYFSQDLDFYARHSKTANTILNESKTESPSNTIFGRLYDWLFVCISLFHTRLGPRITPYPRWKTFMRYRLQIAKDISCNTLTLGQFQALGLGRNEDEAKQFFFHQIVNRSQIGQLFEANPGPVNWMMIGVLGQITANLASRVETARSLAIIVSELEGTALLLNEDTEIDNDEYQGHSKRRKMHGDDENYS